MADVQSFKTRMAMLQKKADLALAAAERETRPLTDAEKADLTALEKEIDGLAARIASAESDAAFTTELDRITGGGGSGRRATGRTLARGSSWGSQFLAVAGDFFKQHGHRAAGAWQSPTVELPYATMFATTLTEDAGSGGPLVLPEVTPGIMPLPTRKLVVADLLGTGTTSSNAVTHLAEKTFSNAAAPVLEGGVKPESALVFEAITEAVRKIACFLPATDEILEDVAQMASYIDARLRLGIMLAEDDQLLNGNGTAPNLLGLRNRPGLAATVTKGASESIADAIARQIAAIATASNLQPDGIVIHPTDYLTALLSKDTQGQYYGNGPFAQLGAPSLWGLPCAVTVGIPVGEALVGAFKMAVQVFRHGPIRVDVSSSHQDWFQKNILAIRCEERIALTVYRPSAVGKVVLL
jgi:HK97 family phage major capsid protein